MTRAEENILRATLNPCPLSVQRIARKAQRTPKTVDRHLSTLRRHGLVKRYDRSTGRAYMATDAGVAAVTGIDRMRR